MENFKGTKGRLKRKYVSGICIGIGTVGGYSEMTANSIIPDTGNNKEMQIMEADMLLYSKAPELLGFVNRISGEMLRNDFVLSEKWYEQAKQLIKEATT